VIQVAIPNGLRPLTGGIEQVGIAARDVASAVAALDARFPGFAAALGRRFAVAIDGEILHDAWHEPLPSGSELHFLPALGGGA
jgi:molybdopterin converting factor small subunit